MICRACQEDRPASRVAPDLCQRCVDLALEAAPKFKAGEFVSSITKAIGIPECGKCRKRREAMNAVDLSGPAFSVFKGLVQAIANPEEADGSEASHDRTEEAGTEGEGGGSSEDAGEDSTRETEGGHQ